MTELPKSKPETADGRIKRMLGVDDKKTEHVKWKLLFSDHKYWSCPSEESAKQGRSIADEYMNLYSGNTFFDVELLDINLSESKEMQQTGTELARKIKTTSTKPMVPSIVLSEHTDQLEDARIEFGPFFFDYIWKEDKKLPEKLVAAVALAESQGPNKPEKYRAIAKDCRCSRCRANESTSGYLYKDIPKSDFPNFDGIDLFDKSWSEKENINTLVDSCIGNEDKTYVEMTLDVVAGLIKKHNLGKF